MPIPQPPPLRYRSGARRFWMALGWFIGVATVGVAAFYAEENWRGQREWTAVQNDLRAKGETLDFRRFVAPPVPDDQNLAMTPLFVRELNYGVDPKTGGYTFGHGPGRSKALENMPFGTDRPDYVKGAAGYELAQPANLTGYQRYFRQREAFPRSAQPGTPAADVLVALTRYGPALDELSRAAAERPLTRFPLDWKRDEFAGMSLAHYNLEQNIVRTLCLRAAAAGASGDNAAAIRDLELGLRLCRDMGREHLVIGNLVQITTMGMMLGNVWEGLAARRWSAAELVRLQSDLQAFDLLADYTAAMRMERAICVHNLENLRREHYFLVPWPGILDAPQNAANINRVLGWVVPTGWFDANEAAVSRCEQSYGVEAADAGRHRVFTERFLTCQPEWTEMQGSLRLGPARFLLGVCESIISRNARVQTALDEAVTACALERFCLAHQSYPARLDELVPAYLARVLTDVIDGAPLRYRASADGRYCLYSIGSDGKDDRGQIAWEGSGRHDFKHGDWPWQYVELKNPAWKK